MFTHQKTAIFIPEGCILRLHAKTRGYDVRQRAIQHTGQQGAGRHTHTCDGAVASVNWPS